MEEENLDIVSAEEPEQTIFQDGKITKDGLICEDGTFIPRFKKEPRPGLTEEDEVVISRWTNDYKRNHDHMDIGLIHMFCTWAYRHPEACEAHVKEQKDKILNMTDEERIEMIKRNPFEDLEKDYERVN